MLGGSPDAHNSRGDGAAMGGDAAGVVPLIPLTVGNAWSYSAHYGGANPFDCTLTHTLTGTIDIDGRHAVVREIVTMCGGSPTTSHQYTTAMNDRYETRNEAAPTWYVLDPPADGHMWTDPDGTTNTWQRAADQTVPAGTFHDCWTDAASNQSGIRHITFCRGVGFVAQDATASDGSTSTTQLTAKSF
jgi:hypothetical protein